MTGVEIESGNPEAGRKANSKWCKNGVVDEKNNPNQVETGDWLIG